MRRPLVVAAQKLFLDLKRSNDFAESMLKSTEQAVYDLDVVICPSLINLAHCSQILVGAAISVGAQNVHQVTAGAHTGQVSMEELLALRVRYIIVGHSELRSQQGETNHKVFEKAMMCCGHDVTPIICVGETRDERDRNLTELVVNRDIRAIFTDITKDHALECVIAYEPVWAIRGGREDKNTKPAEPEDADRTHAIIREVLADIFDPGVAESIRIMYGGSVDEWNACSLLDQPNIDGLLVGSASTDAGRFKKILDEAQAASANRLS